jgi:hypothetical protein
MSYRRVGSLMPLKPKVNDGTYVHGDEPVGSTEHAIFDHKHRGLAVFGQPVGHGETRRATSDNDVVVLLINIPAIEENPRGVVCSRICETCLLGKRKDCDEKGGKARHLDGPARSQTVQSQRRCDEEV